MSHSKDACRVKGCPAHPRTQAARLAREEDLLRRAGEFGETWLLWHAGGEECQGRPGECDLADNYERAVYAFLGAL